MNSHLQRSERKTEALLPFSFSHFSRNWWGVPGFLLLIFVFLLPVCRLVWLSLSSSEGVGLQLYQEVLLEKATWKTIQNTIVITISSTLLALVLGVGLAFVMAYLNIRAKKWLQLLIFLPFLIPSYVATLAWVQFFGGNGPIQFLFNKSINLYSTGGIIFVLGLSHYPLVYLMSVEVLRRIPRELKDAASTSGASGRVVFRKVIFPMALPGIASGGILAFLSNIDNFGIPAFLGIPANIRVLSTYIYEQIIGYGPSAFSRAAVLSVIMGVIALIGTLVQWAIIRKSNVSETAARDMEPRYFLSRGWRNLAELVLWIFLLLTTLVPLIVMASTSFIKAYGLSLSWENLSLKNYMYLLFEDAKTGAAIGNSITLALATMLICMVIGTAIAYLRFKKPSLFVKASEIIVTIPYALPGTVFALAIILMWLQPLPGVQPGIYGTIWILLIAYITRFTVLQMRGSLTAFSQIDPTMEEAARISGARAVAKWRSILFPLLMPGVLSGAALVFLTALTELTVSSLLWSSGSETIGVVIFSFEQAGYTTYSTAFSTLIVGAVLIMGIMFVLLEKIWKQKVIKSD
ncbi:ABC-type Fe3+ transport system, permease component [Niallia nealsonii AAU1]|nr:ABC-type Fe3+ transport system, permease component [Niallia nealsonii AAU1]